MDLKNLPGSHSTKVSKNYSSIFWKLRISFRCILPLAQLVQETLASFIRVFTQFCMEPFLGGDHEQDWQDSGQGVNGIQDYINDEGVDDVDEDINDDVDEKGGHGLQDVWQEPGRVHHKRRICPGLNQLPSWSLCLCGAGGGGQRNKHSLFKWKTICLKYTHTHTHILAL